MKDDTAHIVVDHQSYIIAHNVVEESINNNKSCHLIIRKPIYKKWFERYSERVPNTFIFKEVSRRYLLENKWGIPIPSYVDEEDIVELDLCDNFKNPTTESQFEDHILANKFCAALGEKKFNLDILIDLLNCLDKEKWNKNFNQKLLYKIYSERLSFWASESKNDLKRILDKLSINIESFRKEIIAYHLLKNYRSIINKLVPDYQLYDSLGINTNQLKIYKEDFQDIEDPIVYEINSWDDPVDVDSFLAYINGFSGLLLIEFEKVKNQLIINPQWQTHEVLNAIEIKFQKLAQEIRNDLNDLRRNIPPDYPCEPKMDWSVEQMLSWCKKEYFPYYKWSINKQFESGNSMGETFAEWYYNEYENIVSNNTQILYKFLPNNYKSFNSDKEINIVLIIDNLPYFLNEEIQKLFIEKKYSLSSISPYLSMIPTITEVCKKTLLTGQDRYNKIEVKSYKQILEDKGWIPYFDNDRFKYYPNLGSFKNEKVITPGSYFINYLEIDELFHKSEEKIGVTHQIHFTNLIKGVIDFLCNKLEKHGLSDIANIHIISDHGCTYLHPQIKTDLDLAYFKNNGIEEISHRFIELSTAQLNILPAHISEKCFTISEIKFGTPTNFLIPKKKESFIKIKDHFWSHGGLFPEEVIVPHMIFKKVDIIIKQPNILIKDNSFRYALQKIEFELGNPNDYEMTDIFIGFLNSNFITREQTLKISDVKPKNKITFSLDGQFKKSAIKREQEKLSLEIKFTVKEVRYSFEIDCPISIKSMVETKGGDIFDQLNF